MCVIELFHGGSGKIESITNKGTFAGIFASTEEIARSHGDILTAFTLNTDDILTDQTLNFDTETAQQTIGILREELSHLEEGAVDVIIDAVFSDRGFDEDVREALGYDDIAYASWEIQRLRSLVARKLGYKAVELEDEHGVVYLINSNYVL